MVWSAFEWGIFEFLFQLLFVANVVNDCYNICFEKYLIVLNFARVWFTFSGDFNSNLTYKVSSTWMNEFFFKFFHVVANGIVDFNTICLWKIWVNFWLMLKFFLVILSVVFISIKLSAVLEVAGANIYLVRVFAPIKKSSTPLSWIASACRSILSRFMFPHRFVEFFPVS